MLIRVTKKGKVFANSIRLTTSLSNNYKAVCFLGKQYYVHRLVALEYLPNPNGYSDVNHKDGNKTNNLLSNLEWTSRSMNMKHANQIGLTRTISKNKAKKIRKIYKKGKLTSREVGKMFNVNQKSVLNIFHRRGRFAKGYSYEKE